MTTPSAPQQPQRHQHPYPPVASTKVTNRILVTGATGHVGRAVIAQLAQWWDKGGSSSTTPKVFVRAAAENTAALESLKAQHDFLEVAHLDLNEPESYERVLQDVNTVFSLMPPSHEMLHYAKNFIDACVKAGVTHLLHVGIWAPRGERAGSEVSWHRLIEAYITQCGIEKYLFLHPTNYMSEIFEFDASGVQLVKDNTIVTAFKPSTRISWIDPVDVGKVAVPILIKPHELEVADCAIPLMTEQATMDQVKELVSKITGKPHDLRPVTVDEFKKCVLTKSGGRVDESYLGAHLEYAEFFNAVKELPAPNPGLIAKISGAQPCSLFDFLRAHLQRT